MLQFLKDEGLNPSIIEEIEAFRRAHPAPEGLAARVPRPKYFYYGREVWEAAATALLCGEHLLLTGPKATGKNVLAENLAAAFARPAWDVSFHINTDAASLIGADSFEHGEVVLRRGPVYRCAQEGGFGVLDEINMAKNESLAVLHAMLDFRRVIDVPGYERIVLHEASRFIATMNYGYAGTRELNEALCSRFVVLDTPPIAGGSLVKLLLHAHPHLKTEAAEQLSALFGEIRSKCESAEISSKALDLRGLLAALKLIEKGLAPHAALRLGLSNKCFDEFESELVDDVIRARIGADATPASFFKP